MLVLFERENELDFTLTKEMNIIVGAYADRVKQRLEIITELNKLQGSIVACESVKLLKDVNDADLSKARAFMTAISQTQIKVLMNISFVVQIRAKLVPSCCVIFDLEPLSLSFDFVFSSEIFKSSSWRSLSSLPSFNLVS
ncbi:hypothetical protein Tco_1316429 [Tanacetum coccineum]